MRTFRLSKCLPLLVPGVALIGLAALPDAVAQGAVAQGADASTVLGGDEDPGPVAARLSDLFKKKGKGAKEAKNEEPPPPPEPNLELRAKLQCIDGLVPGDVQTGVMREYDVTEGMKVSQRSAFLDREPATVTDNCFLGELPSGQCFAFTVDQKKYEALGNSNDWQIQCVYSDDPGAGAITNKDEYPYSVDRMPGKAMMLLCGHDEGDAYECDAGNNSGRSGVWQKKLEAQGKQQLGFCAGPYSKQALLYDTNQYPSGRWVYCQYYNSQSKKNLFGYEFLQKVR